MSSTATRARGVFLLALVQTAVCFAATFGTLVPVRGTVGDLALDERRNVLYVSNFAGYRVEVVNTQDRTLGTPLYVSKPPSAVALSPDNRFLIVGLFNNVSGAAAGGGFTIFDLDAGISQEVAIPSPVLGVAFGSGSRALIVTTTEAFLVDPFTARTEQVKVAVLGADPLPVPFATFPQKITKATLGISGDGNTIIGLAEGPDVLFRYRVGETTLTLNPVRASPALGPRAVSINSDGSRFLAGWILWDGQGRNLAQFPYPTGDLRIGGHAFDYSRDAIYANVPAVNTESPVLHVLDTDNLTVRERLQLPQTMAGRSVFSSDKETLYAISDNGILILPIGSLARGPRVVALQPDVLFLGDACNRQVITQVLEIVDPNGAAVDFTLSLPSNTSGVRLSATSGTTPARIRIDVDPTAFQSAKGTTTIPVSIQSSGAINLPEPVRLLINTRDVNQRGRVVNAPGKLTGILADPVRNRIYLVRQDKNLVLVYDSVTYRQIAELRTGNTPVGMTITEDQRYLIVGNDNSQYASVFDLETLQAAEPIPFPGNYPRTFATGRGAIWATVRPGTGGTAALYKVDFAKRLATAPPSLGIFTNAVPDTSALAASPSLNYILLGMIDGTVALWEAGQDRWVVSRKDLPGLGGAFATLNDNLFAAGANLLDESLYPVASMTAGANTASGIGLLAGSGIKISAGALSSPGFLERLDLANRRAYNGTLTIEAPHTAASLLTPRVGQTGQTILPFTRTLAVAPDESAVFVLSQAGLSVIAPNFDAPSPKPVISGVANSADGGPAVASGGLISISGDGLAPSGASAGGFPLPSTLGDVCVTVSNTALPLFRVSSTQILAQMPFAVSGNSPMVVRAPGGISDPFPVNVAAGAPAIFRTGSAGGETGLAAVVRQKNNEILNFTNPIHPNEGISILLTGLGRTSPEAPLGDAAPADPLAIATLQPEVSIGGTPLQVDFAGLVPGQIGVYQINATVPDNIADAAQAPLTIKQGTNSTTITVRVVTP